MDLVLDPSTSINHNFQITVALISIGGGIHKEEACLESICGCLGGGASVNHFPHLLFVRVHRVLPKYQTP